MGIREFTPTQQQKNNQTLNIRKAERSGRRSSSKREQRRRRTNLLDGFFVECLRIQAKIKKIFFYCY
jgi:hypothetical protein